MNESLYALRHKIQEESREVLRALKSHVSAGEPLCVIKAPPGSGKTFTLREAIGQCVENKMRIAVAGQTNAQCNDICRRLVATYPNLKVWRFAARGATAPDDLRDIVNWVSGTDELPSAECVVVGTTAKWGLVKNLDPFDFLLIDEAWQMGWADFMLLSQVAPRFVLIGDPGQIPPVVTIPVNRWETSPRAPHLPAPSVILADPSVVKLSLELRACRRLPVNGVKLIRPFYDFHFDAWALPGERYLKAGKSIKKEERVDSVLRDLEHSTSAILTLPTPAGGPPLEGDLEIAAAAAGVAVRALDLGMLAASEDGAAEEPLKPEDIGISATHRVMNSAVVRALPDGLRNGNDGVRVDTPERWQGLQRKLMIVVHPLSGVVEPSPFDLETGRLCVMASRHRSAMVVVSRDHVGMTLESHIPSAEQAVGRPDTTGRGHAQHAQFWSAHHDNGWVSELTRLD